MQRFLANHPDHGAPRDEGGERFAREGQRGSNALVGGFEVKNRDRGVEVVVQDHLVTEQVLRKNHAWGAAPANILPRKLMGVEPLAMTVVLPEPVFVTVTWAVAVL